MQSKRLEALRCVVDTKWAEKALRTGRNGFQLRFCHLPATASSKLLLPELHFPYLSEEDINICTEYISGLSEGDQ